MKPQDFHKAAESKGVELAYEEAIGRPGWARSFRELPENARGAIARYVLYGIAPGRFYKAVLSNDLKTAVACADAQNVALIPQIVKALFNAVPFRCWGSPERYTNWLKRGGMFPREEA